MERSPLTTWKLSSAEPLSALGASVTVPVAPRIISGGGVRNQTSRITAACQALEEYVNLHGGSRVLRRILIANNGMAATKSILSMRQWAYSEFGDLQCLEFVVMATPEDLKANAEYIRLADKIVEVPGGVNRNNYANVGVICKVAQEQKVYVYASVYSILSHLISIGAFIRVHRP